MFKKMMMAVFALGMTVAATTAANAQWSATLSPNGTLTIRNDEVGAESVVVEDYGTIIRVIHDTFDVIDFDADDVQMIVFEGDVDDDYFHNNTDIYCIARGYEGNDQLYGGDGGNWLLGGAGRDSLWGGNGRDYMDAGRDWFEGEIKGFNRADTLWRYREQLGPNQFRVQMFESIDMGRGRDKIIMIDY